MSLRALKIIHRTLVIVVMVLSVWIVGFLAEWWDGSRIRALISNDYPIEGIQ